MVLFKSKALPVVIEDIATSLHRASRNSTTALSLLHAFVRVDPPHLDLDCLVSHLSRDVFRLREECYPPQELAKVTDILDHSEPTKPDIGQSTLTFSLCFLCLLSAHALATLDGPLTNIASLKLPASLDGPMVTTTLATLPFTEGHNRVHAAEDHGSKEEPTCGCKRMVSDEGCRSDRRILSSAGRSRARQRLPLCHREIRWRIVFRIQIRFGTILARCWWLWLPCFRSRAASITY